MSSLTLVAGSSPTSRSSNGSRSEPLSETFSSEVPMSTLRAAIALKAAPKEIPLNTPMVATGMTASRSDAMGLVAARAPRIPVRCSISKTAVATIIER
eukprot:CAMPEP_0172653396 /NCGR_PEP_ID=MMETSP1068-20121228/243806_1 /TAXON_ID=35684 /ORGANISM="Pseudopedinella elastica, Strain CCMP716" /LENGTH=97 /DNA_ID=CAMNT_0013467827 /DNA_START=202 /DNA_END=495 /DNA_ORIENTATION=+